MSCCSPATLLIRCVGRSSVLGMNWLHAFCQKASNRTRDRTVVLTSYG